MTKGYELKITKGKRLLRIPREAVFGTKSEAKYFIKLARKLNPTWKRQGITIRKKQI